MPQKKRKSFRNRHTNEIRATKQLYFSAAKKKNNSRFLKRTAPPNQPKTHNKNCNNANSMKDMYILCELFASKFKAKSSSNNNNNRRNIKNSSDYQAIGMVFVCVCTGGGFGVLREYHKVYALHITECMQ